MRQVLTVPLDGVTNYMACPVNLSDTSVWEFDDVTVEPQMIANGPGRVLVDYIEETAANSAHNVGQALTAAAGPIIVAYVFKSAGRDYAAIYVDGKGKFFDLASGTVGGNMIAPPTSSGIEDLGNGFYRCWIGITASGGAIPSSVWLSHDGASFSYAGDISKGIYASLASVTDEAAITPYFDGSFGGCAWVATARTGASIITANSLSYADDATTVLAELKVITEGFSAASAASSASADAKLDAVLLKTDTIGGAGAIAWPYTLTMNGLPCADAAVWVTSDEAGNNVVASGRTNDFGALVPVPKLDAGTYYFWAKKSGVNFDVDIEVVT